MTELETGDSLLVVVATHEMGHVRPVGTFTELRLAKAGGDAYMAMEFEGSGPVEVLEIFDTALNQHGVCPRLHFRMNSGGWR